MELRHLSYFVAVPVAVFAVGALVCLRRAVHAGDSGTGATADEHPAAKWAEDLAALTYELLDAHADTAHLTDGLPYDPAWAAHVEYLRALQRKGRETLARATAEELEARLEVRRLGTRPSPGG